MSGASRERRDGQRRRTPQRRTRGLTRTAGGLDAPGRGGSADHASRGRAARGEAAMRGAEEAVQTMPAETGTPVEIGLEQAAGDGRRQRQPEREAASAR